jgi:hypothetical protein
VEEEVEEAVVAEVIRQRRRWWSRSCVRAVAAASCFY